MGVGLPKLAKVVTATGPVRAVNLGFYKALSPVTARRTRAEWLRLSDSMGWIEHAVPPQALTVSVITCTRNRVELLRGAIESVRRQWHDRWQLVIVDDGSTDDTPSFLTGQHDARIITARTAGMGPAAARNVGLGLATGDLVTFLDDDNRLHPSWLKAVAWSFRDPSIRVGYGARVMESREPVHGCTATKQPGLHFPPYSRRRQRYANAVDLGVLAHRRGPLRFDPDPRIKGLEDWDYFQRLTEDSDPVRIPTIASFYATGAGRLSSDPTSDFALNASKLVASRHRSRG